METNGTVNKIIFKMVRNPLVELSSSPNEFHERIAKMRVYVSIILFFKMSRKMILMTLFIAFIF